MKQSVQSINLVIAETSPIVRIGLSSMFKRMQSIHIQPIEATSPEGLENCLHTHTPQILLVNPTFGGWFNIEAIKSDPIHSNIKCIAINCNIIDHTVLKAYDEQITLYDNIEAIESKIIRTLNISSNEENEGSMLSEREKEIVICIVKGMTNKEIADMLYISPHTVMTHRKNIARKLEIHSTAGLTIYAIINKLVELSEIKL